MTLNFFIIITDLTKETTLIGNQFDLGKEDHQVIIILNLIEEKSIIDEKRISPFAFRNGEYRHVYYFAKEVVLGKNFKIQDFLFGHLPGAPDQISLKKMISRFIINV